jgi:signal transduction histidine kinase/ligand-binding sensor domain-containing protein
MPSSALYSQQLYFKYYTINEGFPHAQVWDIFQDRQGYVWFATAGGVARYNGTEFTVYTKDDGMVSNVVRSIFQDDDGKIWVCTDDGVSVFDGRKFINYTTKDGLASGAIFEMAKDRTGNYWFVSSHGGLSRFDGKTFRSFSKKDGIGAGEYRNIFKDQEGNLWFSGKSGLWLLPFNGKTYADSFMSFQVDGVQDMSDIEEYPAGRIIVGSNRGLILFNYSSFTRERSSNYNKFISEITVANGLPNPIVHEIAVAPDSAIWLATDEGICKWQKNTFTGYLADENISTNSCHSLLLDREGTVWVGTDGGGCFKLPYQNIFNFTMKDGLSANVANAIAGDESGHIFVGTDNGVDMYDGQKFTSISREVIGTGNTVWSLKFDSRGTLWIGTDKNLFEYRNGQTISRKDIYAVAGSSVLDIIEDRNHILWFGTLNGLIAYDGKNCNFYDEKRGLPGNQVWCVFADQQDQIWLGINGGLVKVVNKGRLDSLQFKIWTTAEGLQDNTVNVVTQDPFGTYWIGTDLGFAKFDGDSFTNYKPKSLGLADNIVPIIQYDSNADQLWVGSKGFGRFDIHTPQPELKKLLNKERGLRVDDPTTNNSFFIDSNRIVWIAHFGGLTRYYEDSVQHVKVPPKIFIERMITNDSLLLFRYLSSDGNESVPDLESKYVVFQFAGLSFLNEKDNSYQYMLEGFDNDWSTPSKNTEVRYTNLNPGLYTFKVKMRNSENTESEQPAAVVFNVPAPWWLNPFVVLLFLSLVSYSVYKGYRIRVNLKLERIRKRNEYLESEVQRRTAEIVNQKEELENILQKLKQTQTQLVQSEKMAALGQLVAGVAHEINNPTSVLAGNVIYVEDYVNVLRKIIDKYEHQYVDNLEFLRELNEFKKQIDYEFVTSDLDTLLNSIKNAAERIRHIVLDLRNFSRLDEVELNEVDINASIDTTVKLFMNQFKHVLKIEKDYRATNIIYCYINQINQVILNILINAAQAIETKYAGHSSSEIPGRIDIVTTNVEKGGVTVKIRDNGLGIPKDVQSKVFDPFYTTKPVGQGTGLGLSISYSIIEKHHGTIAYESVESQWTEFTFTLPFKPHEIPS